MSHEPDRVAVSTYVPTAQRDVWREEADDLGMSQSEFVRSMVQAGRRGFSLNGAPENRVEPDPPGSDPGGNDLKGAVLDVLREEGPLGWSGLVDEVIGDLENDLEDALMELQKANRIEHSPRHGTYSLARDRDGE